MEQQLAIDAYVMAVIGVLAAGEGVFIWRCTRLSGHRFLAFLPGMAFLAATCAALLFCSSSERWIIRFAALWEIVGSMGMVFVFLFTARFCGLHRLCGRVACVSLIGCAAVFIVAVGLWPGLVYLPGHGLGALSFTHESVGAGNGPLFWLQNGMFWALVVASGTLLLREAWHGRRLHVSQALAGTAAITVIVGVQVLSMAGLVILPGVHCGVIAFTLGMLPLLVVMPRLHASDARIASERSTLEAMSDAVLVLGADGRLVSANRAARELMAHTGGDDPRSLGDAACDGAPCGVGASRRTAERVISAAGPASSAARPEEWSEELVELRLAGHDRTFQLRRTMLADDGRAVSSVAVLRDVTDQVRAQAALRASEERLRILFDQSPVGILLFDADLTVQDVNVQWSRLVGHDAQHLVGRTLGYDDVSSLLDTCRRALSGESGMYNGPLVAVGGEDHWFECEVTPLRDPSGQVVGGLCFAWDVTETRRHVALIERLSLSDTVTGLPNRTLLRDRLRRVLAAGERAGRVSLLAIVDVDGFAAVNEALGHVSADHLLEAIGARLRSISQAVDTVARWGADEFAVVGAGLAAAEDAVAVIDQVRGCFAAPWLIDGRELWLTASIGVAQSPADGQEIDGLFGCAENAMHSAKKRGGDCVCYSTEPQGVRSKERLALAADLHRALDEGQFELFYQPQVEMADGRMVGCEALVRWRHPDHDLVRPDLFIPLAEGSGLIVEIGEWVLREACSQAVAWASVTDAPLRMAVNLSARQLRQDDLVAMIARALVDSELEPERLELEITETALLYDPQAAARRLKEIASLGVGVALDDFGTGYSSLTHLCELPVDRLKIDRSFVGRLPVALEAAAVCRAVIDLAQNLGVAVIAEGVETAEQVAYLRHHGCREAQGYFFGRPLPAADFADRLMGAQANEPSRRVATGTAGGGRVRGIEKGAGQMHGDKDGDHRTYERAGRQSARAACTG